MDIDLKTTTTHPITVRKSAIMLAGTNVTVAAELFNGGDQDQDAVSISLAILDPCSDPKAVAETAIGHMPPLESRLVNFTLPLVDPDFIRLDFKVEIGRPLHRL